MIELDGRGRLVDAEQGIVSRRVFADPELHRLEQDRVFRRTWCFLGHESSIREPGSYTTTWLGEDPVILWRGADGGIRAFLNTCPHRGNSLALFDAGRAPMLTCSYHGWCFASDGRLARVPFADRAYYGTLDQSRNGLAEIPRVRSYGGLVFGCWDPDAPELERYLGDLRWWLDVFLCFDDLGGLEVLPGCQRYVTSGNWKVFCDNFAGDRYHTPTTHSSATRLGLARPTSKQGTHGYFMAFMEPAHGLGGIFTDTAMYEADLALAERFGPEVVDYVRRRFELARARMKDVEAKPTHFSFGLVFPNLCLQGVGGAFRGNLVGVCHPKGQHQSLMQQWVLVEREAPEVVKRAAAAFVARGQSGAGLIGPDDTENFDRITDNTRAPSAARGTFHYGMGVEHEGNWPGQETWHVAGLPGLIGPEFWEVSQRRFYGYWAELMGLDGQEEVSAR